MDELHDALIRIGSTLLAWTLAIGWGLAVLALVLPEIGHLAGAFLATPGGLVIALLAWRGLAPRLHRRR